MKAECFAVLQAFILRKLLHRDRQFAEGIGHRATVGAGINAAETK
jgi:hypothetical protein